jgi:hypothetical protein
MKHLCCIVLAAVLHLSRISFQTTCFNLQWKAPRQTRQYGQSDLQNERSRIGAIQLAQELNNFANATIPLKISATRRRFFQAASTATLVAIASTACYADIPMEATTAPPDASTEDLISTDTLLSESTPASITVPLIFTGQELLISYKVDDSRFRAVLDTGSPFLLVPGSCGLNTQRKSGCYRNQGRPTGLETTIEIFDGFEGEVEWRHGPFDFVNVTDNEGRPGTMLNLLKRDENDVIFGVASEDIMGGPGGVFFGMIKNTDARIRPSFLGQTNVQSFQVDLKSRPRTLTLSNQAMIDASSTPYIPMTNVLRRRYGDPVGHYTARACSIFVNGYPLFESSASIFVIFDTGVTGMIVSRGLFNEQYATARKRKDKSLFGNVTLTFDTRRGDSGDGTAVTSLTAIKPLTTPFDPEKQWKRFPKSSHIIVLGLAFLEDRKMTVDIDRERLSIT